MLIRFKVKNFLSFDKEEEFSMISGRDESKKWHIHESKNLNLLRFTAIFGANASGKSNLITAMKFARNVIIHKMPSYCRNQYFRINGERKKETSKFEFEIVVDGKCYAYGFELILNKESITEEWLYELKPDNSEKRIFERNIGLKTINFGKEFEPEETTKLSSYSDAMMSDDSILFLTEMNRNKEGLYEKYKTLAPFREVYHWFKSRFIINYPDEELSQTYFDNVDEINNIIPKLGLGIYKCKIVLVSMGELQQHIPEPTLNKIFEDFRKFKSKAAIVRGQKADFILKLDPETQEILVQKLQMGHEQEDTWFDISEESDGTRRIFDLLELLTSAKVGTKKVYVIDEINRRLHPLLTYKLIKMYLDHVDQKEIQLIVTTHEARLLDLNLLRRDEIWFIKKDNDGSSHFFSLDQYGTDFDKELALAYLDGRYEGVPRFDEFVPSEGGNE